MTQVGDELTDLINHTFSHSGKERKEKTEGGRKKKKKRRKNFVICKRHLTKTYKSNNLKHEEINMKAKRLISCCKKHSLILSILATRAKMER